MPASRRCSAHPTTAAGGSRRRRKNFESAGNTAPDTLILETRFETDEGVATLIDFMPLRNDTSDLVRLVVGESGRVTMCMELIVRFGYGCIVPWVTRLPNRTLRIVAGPDMVVLRTPIETHGENFKTVGEFTVSAGETVPFTLIYTPSHLPPPERADPRDTLAMTETFWRDWTAKFNHDGPFEEIVTRSLITLKALTYAPTGGIVAAPTTSLPEWIGGVRNWDYRFCWLRDATLTLLAFMNAGYYEEAAAWREWLLRAVAGRPEQAQIMYGIAGERRLVEWDVPWLPGFRNSASGAHRQQRAQPAPARRLRRGDGRPASGPPRRHRSSRRRLGGADRLPQASRDRVDRARREHLGGAQRPAAFHLFQGDGLGRLRPRHQERRGISPRRPGRALARAAHADPRRRVPEGLRSRSRTASCSPMPATSSTRACCCCRWSASCRRRTRA